MYVQEKRRKIKNKEKTKTKQTDNGTIRRQKIMIYVRNTYKNGIQTDQAKERKKKNNT